MNEEALNPTPESSIESLVIDGEWLDAGVMMECSAGDSGFIAPFALFSPDLQQNVGGPYASFDHAEAARQLMLKGDVIPYTTRAVTWTIKGKPSPWYDK